MYNQYTTTVPPGIVARIHPWTLRYAYPIRGYGRIRYGRSSLPRDNYYVVTRHDTVHQSVRPPIFIFISKYGFRCFFLFCFFSRLTKIHNNIIVMQKIPSYRFFLKCAAPAYSIMARYVSDTSRIRVSDGHDTGRIENPIWERNARYVVSDRVRIGDGTYPCFSHRQVVLVETTKQS